MNEEGVVSVDMQHEGRGDAPPIYVVSGGVGAIGEMVARVALAQFQGVNVPVIKVTQIRQIEQVVGVIEQAAATHGTILHTMVDRTLRRAIIRMARERNIVAIDLVGSVLSRLTTVLGRKPVGLPGLHQSDTRDAHFDRVDGIKFTMEHDDGARPQELEQAEIVLAGISRVGKTPLSIYLGVLGWKVANIPLVPNVPPPPQLFTIDRRRVIGLIISTEQITAHRRWRQRRMGVPLGIDYTDLHALEEEMDQARRLYRRHGFAMVDLTDKPIEESADEVIALITRFFKHGKS